MSYPDPNAVQSFAGSAGVDLDSAFAYAGLHGILPSDGTAVIPLVNNAQHFAAMYNVPVQLVYGYEWSNGVEPNDQNAFFTWLSNNGYWDPNKKTITGSFPPAGQGYPPGGQMVNPLNGYTGGTPTTSAGGTTTQTPIKIPDVGAFVNGHLPLIAGGLAAYLLLTGKLRRVL